MPSAYRHVRTREESTRRYAPSLFDGVHLSGNHAEIEGLVSAVPGRLQPADQLKLYEMAYFATGAILEVGRAQGKSLSILATAVRDAGSGLPIYSIDMSERSGLAAEHNLRMLGLLEHVTLVHGDSAEEIIALEQVFGLVFLDGDHSYEGVKRDLQALRDLVEPGGSVMLHDYFDRRNHDPADSNYGVVAAADELAPSLSLEFRGGYGAIALFEQT